MEGTRSHKVSLGTQAVWLFTAKLISTGIMMGVPILLARALDQNTYGLYRQSTLLLGTGMLVLVFGYIFSAYYYFPAGPERRLAAAWNVILFLGCTGTLALVVFTVYPRIVQIILGGSELVPYAPLIGVILFLQCVGYPLEHFAIADGQFQLSTVFIISIQLSRAVLLYGVAAFAPTLRNLLLAAAAQGLIQVVAFLSYISHSFSRCWQLFSWRFFREQFLYVLPMALAGLLYMFGLKIPSYVVSHQYTPAAFAIFSVGCLEVPFMGLVREALGSVMIPRISELKFQGNLDEIRRLTASASSKLAIANCAFVGVLLACGPDFITLLYSRRYYASWPIFAVNLIPWLFEIPLVDPIGRAFPEVQRKVLVARVSLLVPSVMVMIHYGPRFGMIFIAAIHVVIGGLERIYVMRIAAVRLQFRASEWGLWRDVPKAAMSAVLAMLGGRWVLQTLSTWPQVFKLISCGIAFVLVYGLCLLATRAITYGDFSALLQVARPVAPEAALAEAPELEESVF
jgi:O-antigen/teichoic acid export membrane protein